MILDCSSTTLFSAAISYQNSSHTRGGVRAWEWRQMAAAKIISLARFSGHIEIDLF